MPNWIYSEGYMNKPDIKDNGQSYQPPYEAGASSPTCKGMTDIFDTIMLLSTVENPAGG